MTEQRTINTGGGDYREIHNEGNYAEGDIINLSGEQRQTLAEAGAKIQKLLGQLGMTTVLIQRRERRQRLKRRCKKSKTMAL